MSWYAGHLDVIKQLYAERVPTNEIALRYGTTKSAVVGLAYRQGWAQESSRITLFDRLDLLNDEFEQQIRGLEKIR